MFAWQVLLPFDESPGALIGRRGRNVRAFEQSTGCDLLLDEAPGSAVVSAFDPARRQAGRLVLMNLLLDGRIHPERIDETSRRALRALEPTARHIAEEAVASARADPLPAPAVDDLGRLSWLRAGPTTETDLAVSASLLARGIAVETGEDPLTYARAGLLCRIGLVSPSDRTVVEESAWRAARHGLPDEVIRAIRSDTVAVARRLAESRPGAARPALESAWDSARELEREALRVPGVVGAVVTKGGRRLTVAILEGADTAPVRELCRSGSIELVAVPAPRA
jgi:ribonuclease Y